MGGRERGPCEIKKNSCISEERGNSKRGRFTKREGKKGRDSTGHERDLMKKWWKGRGKK